MCQALAMVSVESKSSTACKYWNN